MIEGTMDRLIPQSVQQLEDVLAENVRHRRWTGLILTGSEITLHHDLPRWARRARASGFERVRVQTHGMRLASRDYCTELVAAGVNEFFVSVAAADAQTHDAITGVRGSFAKTMQGLENLEAFRDVVSITNTVVTERSYRQLPALVDVLESLDRLVQMEFWVYWPMTERDEKDLIASHLAVLPYLKDAIHRLRGRRMGVEVKNFPECLLGEDGGALDNDQPQLLIDPAFWPEFARNGFHHCLYRNQCASRQCLGLNAAYVERFGELAQDLHPIALSSQAMGMVGGA